MSTDERTIVAFLQRSRRRRHIASSLIGAGIGVGVAVACLGLGWLGLASRAVTIGLGIGVILAGALFGALLARREGSRIALEIEQRAPDFRNLLVTAAELVGPVASPRRLAKRPAPSASPAIVRLVTSRAAEQASRLDAASLFPLQRRALWFGGGLAVWSALAVAVPARSTTPTAATDSAAVTAAAAPDVEPAIDAVEIALTPPPYTGLPARRLVDPARLEVVEGTRIAVSVRAAADALQLATLQGNRELTPAADGAFRAELVAAADGFLSLEPRRGNRAGPRRLVGLLVTPDAPPLVRITEPGRDLFLPQPDVEIPLAATATDDFGIAELRLTYTIVSGSGETFEFTEGELAAQTTREDEASWRLDAELRPAALGLSLGDMVVYRAVARDRRPDAPDIISDAFVVEIVGENAAITGGFALESDEEREALSQRMVIVKTERLLARKDSIPEPEYAAEARRIAAEQRLVRAEFVFMMGGEIQDEVEEAEHEHEVVAGRLELAGRQEMSRAVQWMSQAATMLADADLEAALPLEESALEALQSALSRSRYILRTMSPRQSIDLTRRLSGTPPVSLDPSGSPRAAGEAVTDPELAALRRLLAEIAAAAGGAGEAREADAAGASGEGEGVEAAAGSREEGGADATGGSGDAAGAVTSVNRARLADLAEEVLRLDPSSAELQGVAADLAAASAPQADVSTLVARAIDALRARLDAGLPVAPAATDPDPELAGALSDEMARWETGREGGR